MQNIGISLVAASVLALSGTANAASHETAAVQKVVRQINVAGELPKGCDASTAIIDEFAPFAWSNWTEWLDALGKYNTANAITGQKLGRVKFRHVNIDGDHAYVVTSGLITYRQSGHAHSERGMETLALEKGASGWCPKSSIWLGKTGADAGAEASAIGDVVTTFASLKPDSAPPPTAITDEFPPYTWQGANAAADWHAGLEKMIAVEHGSESDLVLTPGKPVTLSVNGNKAYGVYPTVIHFKNNGKTEVEHGTFAFAFEKSGGAWHIGSWAWATD